MIWILKHICLIFALPQTDIMPYKWMLNMNLFLIQIIVIPLTYKLVVSRLCTSCPAVQQNSQCYSGAGAPTRPAHCCKHGSIVLHAELCNVIYTCNIVCNTVATRHIHGIDPRYQDVRYTLFRLGLDVRDTVWVVGAWCVRCRVTLGCADSWLVGGR